MARLVSMLGEIKGSVGGLTFQGSGDGQIIRQRVKPITKNTVLQSRQRNLLAGLARSWAYELTDGQRNGWNSLAPEGITGYQLFTRINNTRRKVGDSPFQDAPANLDVRTDTLLNTQEYFASSTTATFDTDPVLSGTERLYAEIAINLPSSLTNWETLYAFLGVSILGAVNPFDINIPAHLLPLLQGKKIAVRMYRYNSVNGVLGTPFVQTMPIEPPE